MAKNQPAVEVESAEVEGAEFVAQGKTLDMVLQPVNIAGATYFKPILPDGWEQSHYVTTKGPNKGNKTSVLRAMILKPYKIIGADGAIFSATLGYKGMGNVPFTKPGGRS